MKIKKYAICSLLVMVPWVSAQEEPRALLLSKFISKAQEQDLASKDYWHRLLHFEKNAFFQYRSAIDDPGFFLSPTGPKDAQAELEATLAAFLNPHSGGEEPTPCLYPARYSWLDENLGLKAYVGNLSCERFENWKAKLSPSGVSIIFAAYYLNNPASTYGHTFLKLKRQGYEKEKGLLDYTVNYAAVTDTQNGVMFAIKGLLGGYRGRFSTEPYYIKIQQYNNIDFRDLWEYELNLSSAAVNRLVEHLWELGQTSMAYYFFNKNCSYQLLPLLDVAEPSINLSEEFRFRAIPVDTLRSVLKYKNLIGDIKHRPSHVRQMLKRRSYLNDQQIKLAEELVLNLNREAERKLSELPADRQALLLDSAHDLLRYRYGFYREQPEPVRAKEHRILLLRKDIPKEKVSDISMDFDLPPPESGHGSGRVGVAFGADKENSFSEISIRSALHDLEANPTGFVPGSQLEMFNLRVRHDNDRGKTHMEEFTMIEILSLTPWDRWVHPPSWHVRTGFDVAHDLDKDPEDSLFYGLSGGSGYTVAPSFMKKSLVYAMWQGDGGLGGTFDDGYRGGMGGVVGAVVPIGERIRIHGYASALRFFMGNVSNRVRFHGIGSFTISQNWETRIIYDRQNAHQEGSLGLNYYW
jgi:hypothetical protein